MKNLFTLFFVSIFAISAQAMDSTTSAKASDFTAVEGSNEAPAGWVPFAALGVSAVEFDQTLTNRDGIAGDLRIIGSYYARTAPWVFDAGLGFDAADLNAKVNSGLLELAGRYRFTSSRKWHAGPVANLNFGDNVGVDYGSSEADVASFVGAQLIRDFAIAERGILRAGLKAMTDIGIPNSTVNKFLFELQFGMVGLQTKVTETHEVVKVEEAAPVEVIEEKIEEKIEEVVMVEKKTEIIQEAKAVVVEKLIATKNPQSLYFETGKETVGPKNKAYILKLVSLLNSKKDLIKEINLTGFADSRGNALKNDALSISRANEIARELKAAGLQDIKINMLKGGVLAQDVESDLNRARRVDVEVLSQATADSDLEAALKSIQRKN